VPPASGPLTTVGSTISTKSRAPVPPAGSVELEVAAIAETAIAPIERTATDPMAAIDVALPPIPAAVPSAVPAALAPAAPVPADAAPAPAVPVVAAATGTDAPDCDAATARAPNPRTPMPRSARRLLRVLRTASASAHREHPPTWERMRSASTSGAPAT
jgi:hypothetical protein